MSLGAPCQCGGETLGSNRSWIPSGSTPVEEPSSHVLTWWAGRLTAGASLLGRGEGDQMWGGVGGCQLETPDFICATHGHCSLVLPQASSCLGLKLQ